MKRTGVNGWEKRAVLTERDWVFMAPLIMPLLPLRATGALRPLTPSSSLTTHILPAGLTYVLLGHLSLTSHLWKGSPRPSLSTDTPREELFSSAPHRKVLPPTLTSLVPCSCSALSSGQSQDPLVPLTALSLLPLTALFCPGTPVHHSHFPWQSEVSGAGCSSLQAGRPRSPGFPQQQHIETPQPLWAYGEAKIERAERRGWEEASWLPAHVDKKEMLWHISSLATAASTQVLGTGWLN